MELLIIFYCSLKICTKRTESRFGPSKVCQQWYRTSVYERKWCFFNLFQEYHRSPGSSAAPLELPSLSSLSEEEDEQQEQFVP